MPSVAISASLSGNNTIIAAPGAGKFIRVYGYIVKNSVAVDVTWKSGSTNLSGAISLNSADSGAVLPVAYPSGWFDCGVNEALILSLSGAQTVTGHLHYGIFG